MLLFLLLIFSFFPHSNTYFFNMFRWDAHLVTYSTQRGVPLRIHRSIYIYILCVCVPMFVLEIISTWYCVRRFLVNLYVIIIIIIIIHTEMEFFYKLKTIKCVTVCMRDWIFGRIHAVYVWPYIFHSVFGVIKCVYNAHVHTNAMFFIFVLKTVIVVLRRRSLVYTPSSVTIRIIQEGQS